MDCRDFVRLNERLPERNGDALFTKSNTRLLSRGGLSQVRLVKKATDSSRFSQKVRSRRPLSRMRLGHAHCECVSIYGVPNRTV
jgi:hypothetical protein